MEIVKFEEFDTEEIVSMFFDTVHSVNSRDYSQEEIHAWAPVNEKELRVKTWKYSLNKNITYVAKVNGKVVGFSDLTHDGHIDRLFVHKDFQGQGIATALVDRLEAKAKYLNILELDTDASITAKPFFEQRGYKVICSQTVVRKGVQLTNYKMTKKLTK
jgi:putative acetyltransferase